MPGTHVARGAICIDRYCPGVCLYAVPVTCALQRSRARPCHRQAAAQAGRVQRGSAYAYRPCLHYVSDPY
eukprot:3941993-Rhodomonas_salina.4